MQYILTNTYDVTKVKNKMWNNTHYIYLHPEERHGFKAIHKDSVILVAKNLKELTEKIKANERLRQACLEAWAEIL